MKQVILLLTILVLPLMANGQSKKSSPKQRVDSFLHAWLIKKNALQIRQFFDRNIFTNKMILSESCAGYIREQDRPYPARVERQVIKFLSDFASAAKGKTLKTKLVYEKGPSESIGQINTSAKDGYILLQAKQDEIANDEEWLFLKVTFPSDEYLTLMVPLNLKEGKGIVYFCWAKQKRTWKIIHLGMECV